MKIKRQALTAIAILAIIVIGIALILFVKTDSLRGQGGIGANSCTIFLQSAVVIGHQESTQIVAAHGRNAWVEIEQPLNATNTVYIAYGRDATATSTKRLSTATSTNASFRHELGLNTDFPYDGSIEALSSTGSTTVYVTICRY